MTRPAASAPLGSRRRYQALFGLIAAAGLRLSEAIRLRDRDVDVQDNALTVHETKFKGSRLLPIHLTTAAALARYRVARDHTMGRAREGPFFVGPTGHGLPGPTVHAVFAGLRRKLGWVARGSYPRRRIHDLRHTFAVRRVQRWQESGIPMDHGTFWLSTYLGRRE